MGTAVTVVLFFAVLTLPIAWATAQKIASSICPLWRQLIMSPKARVKVRAYKGNPVVVVQSSGVHVSSTTGTLAAVDAVDRPLVAALLAYGVNDGELAELLAALDEDRSTHDGSLPTLPSPAVSAWIQRVSMRVAGFSNLAGATAVGNVISTLVFRHYGIGAA